MEKKSVLKFIISLVLLLVIVCVSWYFGLHEHFDFEKIRRFVEAHGVLAPVLYLGLYIIATIIFLPITVLTIGAGVVFGSVWGILIAVLGDVLSAMVAFLFSRFMAADFVRASLEKHFPSILDLDEKISENGLLTTMILRFIPVAPYTIINLGLGLTRLRVKDYVLGTFLGVFPLTVVYVYFGSSFASLDLRAIVIAVILMVIMYFFAKHLEKKHEDIAVLEG